MIKNLDLWSLLCDMQLIGKLTVSAAALVLITLAYKYYSAKKRTTRKAKGYGSNGSEATLHLEEKKKIKEVNAQYRDKVTEKHPCKDYGTEVRQRHMVCNSTDKRCDDVTANSNVFGNELLDCHNHIKWSNVHEHGQEILLGQQESIDIRKLKFLEADLIQSTDFQLVSQSSSQQMHQTAEESKEDIHSELNLHRNGEDISLGQQESIDIRMLKFLEADLVQSTDFITQNSTQQVHQIAEDIHDDLSLHGIGQETSLGQQESINIHKLKFLEADLLQSSDLITQNSQQVNQTAEKRKQDVHDKLNVCGNVQEISQSQQEDIDIHKLKFLKADLILNTDFISQSSPQQADQTAKERKEDIFGKLNVTNVYDSDTYKEAESQNNHISSRHGGHISKPYDYAVSNKSKNMYDLDNAAHNSELLAYNQMQPPPKAPVNDTPNQITIQEDDKETPQLDLSEDMKEAEVVESRNKPAKDSSGIGLTLNQKIQKPGSVSTFSSVAEVQVEESYISDKDNKSTDDSKLQSKKCIIYDYYVESASQTLEKDKSYMYEIQNPNASVTHYTVIEEIYKLKAPSHEDENPEVKNATASITSDSDSLGIASVCINSTVTSEPSSGEHLLHDLEINSGPEVPSAPEAPLSEINSIQKNQLPFERKGSFYEIVDNPELQLSMDNFQPFLKENDAVLSDTYSERSTTPRPNSASPTIKPLHSSQSDSKKEANVEIVAGANFLQMPMIPDSCEDITKCKLDLGNCYDVLCMAKHRRLDDVQEAVYKVMSDNYLQVLKDPSIYGNLKASERDLILEMRMKGKKYLSVADIDIQDLMQAGPLNLPKLDSPSMDMMSVTNTNNFSKLCYYDDQSNTWHFLTSIPKEAVSNGCAICTMFNYLFIVAGCQGLGKDSKPTNRFFCYNPVTDIWREICPLNQARPQCRLVALDGYIYAIGGECLSTVEKYDPKTDRWSFVAPLPNDIFAVGHFSTVSNGEIYVSGGTLKHIVLRYNPKTDTWKESSACGTKDRTTDLIAVKHFIYRFDLNRSMGISAYRCSSSARLWYECSVLRTPYPGPFQCTVVDNIICCVSRQFHKWFLADEIYPRFLQNDLKLFPSPKGSLFPSTLVLPDKDTHQTRV
ncbi:uncharacterized protein LOC122793669 [Protopterus annectens]|uniref:uncharacterized protein LOC122793669 n=1 Tax=Protopterus annectens TaxID=7888 RepID=UPI001CF994DF|nr:uncharacterized protein LOC122793669 [Protopterus annectens]